MHRARRRSQTSISRRRGVAVDAHGSRVCVTDAEKAHGDQTAADSSGGGKEKEWRRVGVRRRRRRRSGRLLARRISVCHDGSVILLQFGFHVQRLDGRRRDRRFQSGDDENMGDEKRGGCR